MRNAEPDCAAGIAALMTRPWSEIVAFYDGHLQRESSFQAVGNVARHIGGGQLRSGLFAWTSMHDPCITQMPVSYPYDGAYLRISPRFDGTVEFKYLDTWDEQKQWCRTVAAADTVPRLLRFLHQLRWFPHRSERRQNSGSNS